MTIILHFKMGVNQEMCGALSTSTQFSLFLPQDPKAVPVFTPHLQTSHSSSLQLKASSLSCLLHKGTFSQASFLCLSSTATLLSSVQPFRTLSQGRVEKICWDCKFETEAESACLNSRAPVTLHSEESSKINSLLFTTLHGHMSLSNISRVPPRKSHLVPIFNMGSFGGSLLQAYYVWHLKGMPKVQEEISELSASCHSHLIQSPPLC